MLPTKEEKEMKSDQIKKGVDRAANRSLLYALGLTEEEQKQLNEKQTLQQLIDQKPAEVAMLIKTWLAEE